jgi:hypothetical protein
MRLGKEQAAGYVEDVETAPATEVFQSDMERIPVTPEPQPTVAAG